MKILGIIIARAEPLEHHLGNAYAHLQDISCHSHEQRTLEQGGWAYQHLVHLSNELGLDTVDLEGGKDA